MKNSCVMHAAYLPMHLSLVIVTVILIAACTESDDAFLDHWYKDMTYASHIEMTAVVLGAAEVDDGIDISLLDQIPTMRQDKLFEPNVYLLVFLRNRGNKRAWGELVFRLKGSHVDSSVSVPSLDFGGTAARLIMIPVDSVIVDEGVDTRESILKKLAWKSLFAQ